ncbi:MAG: hypothetical protein R3A11_01960 [Bdellovibrionota bacterium]
MKSFVFFLVLVCTWMNNAFALDSRGKNLFDNFAEAVIYGDVEKTKEYLDNLLSYNREIAVNDPEHEFTFHTAIPLEDDSTQQNALQVDQEYQGKSPLLIALENKKTLEVTGVKDFLKQNSAPVENDPYHQIFSYMISKAVGPGQVPDTKKRAELGLILLDLNQGFQVIQKHYLQGTSVHHGRTLLMQALIKAKLDCHHDISSSIMGIEKCHIWSKLNLIRNRQITFDGSTSALIDHFDINQGDVTGKNALMYAVESGNCTANAFHNIFLNNDGGFFGQYKPLYSLGDENGDTPLMYFVRMCGTTQGADQTMRWMGKFLVGAINPGLGYNPFQKNKKGQNALTLKNAEGETYLRPLRIIDISPDQQRYNQAGNYNVISALMLLFDQPSYQNHILNSLSDELNRANQEYDRFASLAESAEEAIQKYQAYVRNISSTMAQLTNLDIDQEWETYGIDPDNDNVSSNAKTINGYRY